MSNKYATTQEVKRYVDRMMQINQDDSILGYIGIALVMLWLGIGAFTFIFVNILVVLLLILFSIILLIVWAVIAIPVGIIEWVVRSIKGIKNVKTKKD